MDRRGFLGSILALGAAPAVVKASSLMRLWTPAQEIARPTLKEIIQATIRARSGELADNVYRNNALIDLMEARIWAVGLQLTKNIDHDFYEMAA